MTPVKLERSFFCNFYKFSSDTKMQFWLRKHLPSNSAFSDLFIAFPRLNK